jgi:hypothetical protein
MDDAWHIEILKRKLTKHLGVLFPAMSVPSHAGIELHLADAVGSREEIAAGFDEYAPVTDGTPFRSFTRTFTDVTGADWTPVPVLKASTRVVARASNRIFVGAPLCRDLAYLEICIGFTRALIVARLLLGWFPKFLKPCVPCPYLCGGCGNVLKRAQARRDVHEPDSAEHPQGDGLHDACHRAASCARRRAEH